MWVFLDEFNIKIYRRVKQIAFPYVGSPNLIR